VCPSLVWACLLQLDFPLYASNSRPYERYSELRNQRLPQQTLTATILTPELLLTCTSGIGRVARKQRDSVFFQRRCKEEADRERKDQAYLASFEEGEREGVLSARASKAYTDTARDAARAKFLKNYAPRRPSVGGEGAARLGFNKPQRRYSAPDLYIRQTSSAPGR